jgi:hypothetical protein
MYPDGMARPKARPRIRAARVATADGSRYLWIAVVIVTALAVLLLSAPAHAAAASGKPPAARNAVAHKAHRQLLAHNAGRPDKPVVSPYARAAAAHQVRAAAAAPGSAPTMVQSQGLHHRAHRGFRPL